MFGSPLELVPDPPVFPKAMEIGMTDSNSPTEEPTFICQRCMERLPISARFTAKDAEDAQREIEHPAEEDDRQGQLFQ